MKASPVRTHLSQGANDPIMRENLLSLSLSPSISLPPPRVFVSPTPGPQGAGEALPKSVPGLHREGPLPIGGVGGEEAAHGSDGRHNAGALL